ncbi:putative RNA exonuclease Rex3 [Aspergillus mulundensis]|uniref:RNA exonuclease 3 n=1 Tax=Aspergillus mulundensis TaxID=1810919 RepID=A0A3D8SJV9_9EURO|nr:RNA exonuclease 3 [Aspergillus mulundensis]RDW86461.1 RNA exonuclease 3 [Aspergillus mulundensis]
MFAPLGLFKDIPCPQGRECTLMACMFSHRNLTSASVSQDASSEKENAEPPTKRIKLEPRAEAKETSKDDLPRVDSTKSTPVKKPAVPVPRVESTPPVSRQSATPTTTATTPTKRESTPTSGSNLPPRQAPKETLNPRMLQKAPATYNVRVAIVKKLHGALCSLNDQFVKDKTLQDKCLILTPDELITMALDEEEKVARESPTVYSNVVKLRIVKLSKMSKDDWAKELKDYLNKKYYKIKIGAASKEPKPFKSNLTVEEEIAVASHLITPLQGLEEFGYVTRAPTADEIETAKKGVAEAKGWEKCERCNARFQVFPGRAEDGSLTTGGTCTHHPGKAFYPPKKKTDHITGTTREGYFTCCNQKLGESSGCTTGATHVFKVSETKRLASILQFEQTPENLHLDNPTPICFDCEMGYTTFGMELIRLTAVSWPVGEKVLDVLVRPLGEVLDLNSRYSGVFPEHFANAIPYGSPVEPSTSDSTQHRLVSSPAEARSLLLNLVTPTTPLIGHAIDNDLNACRIIHPTVIDTAILYPHPGGGLPWRMSLRTLARKHLDREIQTGGASGKQGHDSAEDALATGDLVRVKAGLVWGRLKEKGWVVIEGKLVAPDSNAAAGPVQLKLGEGAGVKRTREGE